MARVPPPRSPVFEGPDAFDLQIREAALRLAIDWATGRNLAFGAFETTVKLFECYLRTGGTDAPK